MGADDTVTGGGGAAGAGTDAQVFALMARAGVPAVRIGGHTALTGGTYNALYAVDLTDGTRLVLKVPPPPDTPRLAYEAELLCGEARFYASAAEAGVPAPRVLHAESDESADRPPFLLMSYSPGVPWHTVADTMGDAERERLREALGGLVARLHTVKGPGFGYPAQRVAPLADRWALAFAAMAGALLDDAAAYGAALPLPVPELRAAFAAAEPLLAEVTVPALVHFDLWPGNVLLDGPADDRTISGLIDGERMFWGDPLADFASLSLLFSDPAEGPEDDSAFLSGYGAGGGRTDFDGAARRRIALYRCYLYLIMLTETVPRAYPAEQVARALDFAGSRLTAALDVLRANG